MGWIYEKKGYVGYLPYAEWFCSGHYDKAYKLKNLTIDKVMEKLRVEKI